MQSCPPSSINVQWIYWNIAKPSPWSLVSRACFAAGMLRVQSRCRLWSSARSNKRCTFKLGRLKQPLPVSNNDVPINHAITEHRNSRRNSLHTGLICFAQSKHPVCLKSDWLQVWWDLIVWSSVPTNCFQFIEVFCSLDSGFFTVITSQKA